MKSGSICVGAGQGVHTGQVIGDLGFSGNTTAPHLHHVADGANPLEDALPFVIGPYTELGRYDGIADLGKNGWQPATAKEMGLPRTDWPGSNVVVRLNENSSRRSVSFACFTPSTAFVALIMTASGVLAISHAPAFMRALSHLGYPPYFSNLLGLGKLIGVCVLPAPGLTELKEWAYVAFGITVLSACYSHYNAGDGWLALEPLVTFAALVISYRTRPMNRAFLNHQEESSL